MRTLLWANCLLVTTILIFGAETSQNEFDATRLHRAITRGDRALWLRLIEDGADLKARDAKGNSPLHLAALHGNLACVQELLEQGVEVNVRNSAGASPLLYGVVNADIVRLLLQHKANPNAVSDSGMTPLLSAVSRGQSYEVARLLVDAGADVNVTREGPWDGGALYRAIQSGDARTIQLLFEKGAPIAASGKSFSPLHVAAMVGDLSSVRRLIEAGADLNYFDEGYGEAPGHALSWAMWAEHHDVAAYLIEQGTDLHFAPAIGNQTPPMVWAGFGQSGDAMIAKNLIAKGLDVNVANATGETALSYALKAGDDTELVRFLRSQGAKQSEKSKPLKTLPSRSVPSPGEARSKMIREQTQGAIDIMQDSSEIFLNRGESCVSCHHQFHPALAYGMARKRGLKVDDLALGHQLSKQIGELGNGASHGALELSSGAFGGAKGLIALHALDFTPNEQALNEVRFIRETQNFDGIWSTFGRPPLEEPSPFQGTSWAIQAIRLFPRVGEESITDQSIERAMNWMRREMPANLNQRNHQLLGLVSGGERPEKLQDYVKSILAEQRPDGGWAQLPTLASDAWATGQSLYALFQAGGVSVNDPAYQRGVGFLLRTQFDDGSWWVRNRTWPFQPHFDSGFPHGKDQWISIAGTAWAAMALLATIEPVDLTAKLATGQELISLWKESQKAIQKEVMLEPVSFKSVSVDFRKDIQPLFERSCLKCHSGKKSKGGFKLTTRALLMEGGQSGLASIEPGNGAGSAMVRYVSDQVEDLEMPPLNRRDAYPAFNPEEVEMLTRWIDEGAVWPEENVLGSE